MNTHEDFVSYSQAVRLKKLGFDWETIGKYVDCPDDPTLFHGMLYQSWNLEKDEVLAPSLSQAQKWLREEHSLHVDIATQGKHYWTANIVGYTDEDIPKGYLHPVNAQSFDLFEQALSAGIDAALEILEEKI